MLVLIINAQGKKAQRLLNFNTSHVSVNRISPLYVFTIEYFNTSHVSVNPYSLFSHRPSFQISIHLMLVLIASFSSTLLPDSVHFNTSHVSVNLMQDMKKMEETRISIHLMLVLIELHERQKYNYY